MDCATRIRSDYHDYSPQADKLNQKSLHFLKPTLLIIIGFLLGMICRQWLACHFTQSQSAMEKPSTVAMRQVGDVIIRELSPTANA